MTKQQRIEIPASVQERRRNLRHEAQLIQVADAHTLETLRAALNVPDGWQVTQDGTAFVPGVVADVESGDEE